MLARILAIGLCVRVCVCLSVTRRYCIETAARIKLVLACRISSTFCTLCYTEIGISAKIRVLSSGTFPQTAIATSIVHSKLDYCSNSLYYNLLKSQITRIQQIQNSLARAAKAPKFCHITPSYTLFTGSK